MSLLKSLSVAAVLAFVGLNASAADLECRTPSARFQYSVSIAGPDFTYSLSGTGHTFVNPFTVTGTVEWISADEVILHGTNDTEVGPVKQDLALTLSPDHSSAEFIHAGPRFVCQTK